MPYVNVGALVDGVRPKTKKALKEAVLSNLDKVRFDPTGAFDPKDPIDPDELTQGVTLVVTGPDPYTARKWYANVVRVNGSVRVT